MNHQMLILILLLLLLHNKTSKKRCDFAGESAQDDDSGSEESLPEGPVNNSAAPELPPPIESEPRLALVELKDRMSRLSGLLNGIKPYIPVKMHCSIEKFCGMATLMQDIYNFMNINLAPLPEEEIAFDSALDMYQRIQGILNEFKKYVGPGQQKTLDAMLKMNDALSQLKDLMNTSPAATADKEHQAFDNKKVWMMMDAISPLLDEAKQKELDNLIKKLKLFEAINSIDLSSSNSASKEEQMHMMMNIIKPMLNKDQQESLDKFVKLAEMMAQSQKFNFDENEEDEAAEDSEMPDGNVG